MIVTITLVYFVYGLAFFSMGLAFLLETGRFPLLAEARVLKPLAFFGLLHGSHEWLEMFLERSDWVVVTNPILLSWFRLVILAVSFTSLILFGLLLADPERKPSRVDLIRWGVGLGAYLALVSLVASLADGSQEAWFARVDSILRYLLAVPGAMLAGVTLARRARRAGPSGQVDLAGGLRLAAGGFMLYAISQLVVPAQDFYPAIWLNTESFYDWIGVPIQFVRAVCAVVATLSLIRVIQIVEVQRQEQMMAAQHARLDALKQVQIEMERRESLRQELLRHTVIAQEEERARIARELHDETAQVLTAFTLHLAALQELNRDDQASIVKIQQLQTLSRQMSDGLHNLVRDLRPAQLDDLGLEAALQYLTGEASKRMNLDVRLEVIGDRQPLNPLVETVIFRVAQEALTNVARHAGVRNATVYLKYKSDIVSLQVADQGIGFQPANTSNGDGSARNSWGLAGMSERAESVGGELYLDSSPGTGTLVQLSVPFDLEIPGSTQVVSGKNVFNK